MNPLQRDAARAELKTLRPFEHLFVGHMKPRDGTYPAGVDGFTPIGSYVVSVSDRLLLVRRVNLITGATVELMTDMQIGSELREALLHHYSQEYVHSDALCLAVEFACDPQDMELSQEFGRCVYCADVDHLRCDAEHMIEY